MKKIISLFLSITMLAGVLSVSINAYADGWLSQVENIDVNTTYTESASYSDSHDGSNFMGYEYYYDAKYFSLPVRGEIDFYLESKIRRYTIYAGLDGVPNTSVFIFSVNDVDNCVVAWDDIDMSSAPYSAARAVYYEYLSTALPAGEYYLVFRYFNIAKQVNDTFDYQLSYTPSITKPSTFKVSSRKTTSLGLTWGKVGDIDGYQLQKKSGDSYKTLTNTTSNSYTVKNLKSGTSYSFRVRSYVNVDGIKYYSSWKTLTTPTKPSAPSIKTPSTNSKHQIISKWNKVSRCSGYQVQYSKNKSFSSVISTKTVSGQSKTSYTGKNFTKGKTYYVRVRAYKTVNGTKYYGAWSSVKSIKCK